MPIYDLSVPLCEGLPTYPGDPGIEISDWFSLAQGDPANVSLLKFGAHTGTHVDAPAHFIEGASRVESLNLDVLIGEAHVVEVPQDRESIEEAFVQESCPPGADRILFKTRNSAFWNKPTAVFRQDFTYLELDAAKLLAQRGIKLIGIDYLSIEQFGQEGHPTHLALLSQGIVILEGLNLTDVSPGRYELICLPLRIRSGKGDGAPARAVLRTLPGV
jgi:arylformamidase